MQGILIRVEQWYPRSDRTVTDEFVLFDVPRVGDLLETDPENPDAPRGQVRRVVWHRPPVAHVTVLLEPRAPDVPAPEAT